MLKAYLFTTLSAYFAALVGLFSWALLTLLYYLGGWHGLAATTSLQVAAIILIAFAAHMLALGRLQRGLRARWTSVLQVFTQRRPILGTLALIALSLWAARKVRPSR